MCQEQELLHRDAITCFQRRPRRSNYHKNNRVCSCPYQAQTTVGLLKFRGLSSYWTRDTHHLPECPHSRFAQRVNTLAAKYTFCTRLLGFSIAAMVTMKRGVGGLAISPHLMLRAVVPNTSPAFQLLNVKRGINRNELVASPHDQVKRVLSQLNRLFASGKASPTNITPDGKTLLAVSKFKSRSLQPC